MTKNKITEAIQKCGGEVYIVGGAVRDELLNIECKDVDFLVRLLSYEKIKKAIAHLGKVFDQEIGGKVSTLKAVVDGEEFDIAIPRVETSTGSGHDDFKVELYPCASVKTDLQRRDFTFNALAKDCSGNIIDEFGGIHDLKEGLVRAVGDPEERFKEDPLRMLRALQFAARLGFIIEEKTLQAIEKNKELLSTISKERIFMEFEKAWTKGKADNAKLVRLLESLGIGELLFGKQFKPYAINIEGSKEDKVIGSFVAFFIAGGDPLAMRPTNEMLQFLDVAKKLLCNSPDIWKWAEKKHVNVLTQVFDQIGEKQIVERLQKSASLPMAPKELAVSGAEMVGIGLKGKAIGEAQRFLLRKIHDKGIPNNKTALWVELTCFNGQE